MKWRILVSRQDIRARAVLKIVLATLRAHRSCTLRDDTWAWSSLMVFPELSVHSEIQSQDIQHEGEEGERLRKRENKEGREEH